MDEERYARLCRIIASRFAQAPWNEFGIHDALQKMVDARRTLSWISKLTSAVLAEFGICPSHGDLVQWLVRDSELRRAYHRSEQLQSLAMQDGNGSAALDIADVARVMAQQLSNNAWSEESIVQQLQEITDSQQTTFRDVAKHLIQECGESRPSSACLHRFLQTSKPFLGMVRKFPVFYGLRIARLSPRMQPREGRPTTWRVPKILTPTELAAWLSIHPNEMWWLAENRPRGSRHYHRRWSRKRSGGWRLVEAPKAHLKRIQRDIAHGILRRIPPHNAAHGFCPGRNIQSFLGIHTGKRFAMRMDLSEFFPSVRRNQVAAIFRTAGYPDAVSKLLSRLSTTATPGDELVGFPPADASKLEHYRANHLPQGAPTSPALANLAAYRLDCRLLGLARQFEADYTRYADDLVFSGNDELRRASRRFHVFVLSIILEEGFHINARKTRMMPCSARQRATGLVFNVAVNTPRKDYDQLKSILYNCRICGIESQNRDSVPNFSQHLLGRVQFHCQINPRRGAKLMRLYRDAFVDSLRTANEVD